MRLSRNDEKWPQREVPAELRERYLAEGWWTDDTLGALVDRSLRAAPDGDDQHLVRVAPVARHLRGRARRRTCVSSPRSRRPGWSRATSSRSSCRTGAKRSSRSTASRWVATCSCRSCTSTAPRRCASSSARVGRGRTSRPTATATSTISTSSTARAQASCRICSCTSWSGRRTRAPGEPVHRVGWEVVDDASPATTIAAADPDDVCVLAYTSGTTSDPKGVMHSHRTLLAELVHMRAWITPGSPNLMGSPVTHATGMLGAVLAPMEMGQDIHLIDRWDPTRALVDHVGSRHRRGHRCIGVPREHPRPSRVLARARAPNPARRFGRRARSASRSPNARPRTASRSSARTDRPNTRRSPAARSTIPPTSVTAPTAHR